jgi:hypothetical protein
MGEKPNEQDEMGREPAGEEDAERRGPRDAGSGQEAERREAPPAGGGMTRESPTRASMGRPSAAVADDERGGSPAGGGPVETSNLNLSKSNIERGAGGGENGGDPSGAGLAIGDQGAVEEKQGRPSPHGLGEAGGGGGEGPAEPAESINLNSSRSNIERKMPEGGKDAEQRSDHVYQHNQTDLEFTGRE